MKMKIVLGTLTAALLMVGCGGGAAPSAQAEVKPNITEESLGLRNTNLYTEAGTVSDKTEYRTAACGTADKIERAFDNAPPMIPHDVQGILPITAANNGCLGCHMPDVAPSMGATAIPKSHFADFRPATAIGADGRMTKEGKAVDNTSDFLTKTQELNTLHQGRFNCSQCHAPQSSGDLAVENTFRPDFQAENMKSSSNLLDTVNLGVQ